MAVTEHEVLSPNRRIARQEEEAASGKGWQSSPAVVVD